MFGGLRLFEWRIAAYGLEAPITSLDRPLSEVERLAAAHLTPRQAVNLCSYPYEGHLPRFSCEARALRYVVSHHSHPIAEIGGGFDDYLNRLSRHGRHEARRKIRRFEKLTGVAPAVRIYRNVDEIREFHRLATEISQQTYQEKLLGQGLPRDPAFIDMMLREAGEGRVRGALLYLNETPIAFAYGSGAQDSFMFYFTGYAPQYARLSPGNVLLFGLMKALCGDDRFRYFDFGSGDAQYKRAFATRAVQAVSVVYLPLGLRTRALVYGHAALSGLSDAIAAFLQKIGVKEKARSLLNRLRGLGSENA